MNQKNINQKSYLILKNKLYNKLFSFPQSYANIYMISNFVQYDFNQELIHKSEQQRIISVKIICDKILYDKINYRFIGYKIWNTLFHLIKFQ